MPEISAAIIARNEEDTIEALMESLKELDDVVIVDDGSEDNTVALAQKLGAKVFPVGDKFTRIKPTEENIEAFTLFFGWMPTFTEDDVIFDPSAARNYAVSKTKNDWVYQPDCDEIVSWNLKELQKELEGSDKMKYRFNHGELEKIQQSKLYRKSVFSYYGIIHEATYSKNPDAVVTWTDNMEVTHHQEPKEYRDGALKSLELAVVTEASIHQVRDMWYLGREYSSRGMYDRCINVMKRYMPYATDKNQMAEACLVMAKAFIHQGNVDGARTSLLAALGINPNLKEPYRLLAQIADDEDEQVWYEHAAIANDSGALFIRDYLS